MRKLLLGVFALMLGTLQAQMKNNAFDLTEEYGDLLMRRYRENDLTWKRALSSLPNELVINHSGDFSNGVIVQGKGLKVEYYLELNPASNIDNNSPGIVVSHSKGDDFVYDGKRLNHYGLGFHDFKDISSPLNGHNMYLSSWFGIDLFTSGENRLRINNNGNVGIGTVKPDEKLTVKGKIHSEEVRVDLQVPADYVFQKYYEGSSTLKEEYTMPTLEEVEEFTKANHHLPEIPSAAQIKEEGLHLKEMTNLLLQKIEELTLYTIEQEKRIKALEKKLSDKE